MPSARAWSVPLEPLPQDLRDRPFTVRESRLSESRLRGSDLDRSVHGVRLAARAPLSLRERCHLFALRLPNDVFFSHATAALLLGMPLPLALATSARLDVSVAAPRSSPHAAGIRGHRLALDHGHVIQVNGLRLTSPARTWVDLASVLALDDLVAAGDFLIHHNAPLAPVTEITQLITVSSGMRGIRLAREALALLSDRPESPQESKLRLILIRGGLPEPEINHELVDTATGKHVRPDFRFRHYRLILEYQGDYHRTKSQWRKDMTRRSRLEAQGWYVMELNADDLRDPAELVARIRTVLARQR